MHALPSLIEVPLFPLAAVLFPGARISLRIYEPRHLDMLRQCSRQGQGFGICLMPRRDEGGHPGAPAAIGTLAEILDFRIGSDGLLQLLVGGRQRFRVAQTRIRSDGLILARIECWPPPPPQPVPVEYSLLQQIAERLLEVVEDPAAEQPQADLEQAEGLGFRLAQWLPLSDEERQQLLELTEPLQRLHELTLLLPRFQKA